MKQFLIILLFLPSLLSAQSNTSLSDSVVVAIDTVSIFKEPVDRASAGLGFGQDLGGIGGNLIYYPTPKLGFQGGIGYALAGVGYNVGVKYRFLKGKDLTHRHLFLMGIYGYNAAIKVKDAPHLNKIFNGPSLGLGFDSKAMGSSHTYFSFAIFYPFRGSDIQKYLDENYISLTNDLTPITLSISYKMIIH
ncbi:MAG: hypothetical protein ACKOX3_02265 [Bacteroidota bacterium]